MSSLHSTRPSGSKQWVRQPKRARSGSRVPSSDGMNQPAEEEMTMRSSLPPGGTGSSLMGRKRSGLGMGMMGTPPPAMRRMTGEKNFVGQSTPKSKQRPRQPALRNQQESSHSSSLHSSSRGIVSPGPSFSITDILPQPERHSLPSESTTFGGLDSLDDPRNVYASARSLFVPSGMEEDPGGEETGSQPARFQLFNQDPSFDVRINDASSSPGMMSLGSPRGAVQMVREQVSGRDTISGLQEMTGGESMDLAPPAASRSRLSQGDVERGSGDESEEDAVEQARTRTRRLSAVGGSFGSRSRTRSQTGSQTHEHEEEQEEEEEEPVGDIFADYLKNLSSSEPEMSDGEQEQVHRGTGKMGGDQPGEYASSSDSAGEGAEEMGDGDGLGDRDDLAVMDMNEEINMDDSMEGLQAEVMEKSMKSSKHHPMQILASPSKHKPFSPDTTFRVRYRSVSPISFPSFYTQSSPSRHPTSVRLSPPSVPYKAAHGQLYALRKDQRRAARVVEGSEDSGASEEEEVVVVRGPVKGRRSKSGKKAVKVKVVASHETVDSDDEAVKKQKEERMKFWKSLDEDFKLEIELVVI